MVSLVVFSILLCAQEYITTSEFAAGLANACVVAVRYGSMGAKYCGWVLRWERNIVGGSFGRSVAQR